MRFRKLLATVQVAVLLWLMLMTGGANIETHVGPTLIPNDTKQVTVTVEAGDVWEAPSGTAATLTRDQIMDLRQLINHHEPTLLTQKETAIWGGSEWGYMTFSLDNAPAFRLYCNGMIEPDEPTSSPLGRVTQDTAYEIYCLVFPELVDHYLTMAMDPPPKVKDYRPEDIQQIPIFLTSDNSLQEAVFAHQEGFVQLGRAMVPSGGTQLQIVRYGEDGIIQWHKRYPDIPNPLRSQFLSLADGGFMVAPDGHVSYQGANKSTYNGRLIRFDSLGNILWQTTLDYGGEGQVRYLFQGSKGHILTVGCCAIQDERDDVVLMCYDLAGNRIAQRTFGGSDYEMLDGAMYAPGIGLVVYGMTQSHDGDITKRQNTDLSAQPFIAVFDEELNQQWQYIFEDKQRMFGCNVAVSEDKIYVGGGLTNDTGFFKKGAVFQFDAQGQMTSLAIFDHPIHELAVLLDQTVLAVMGTPQHTSQMLLKLDDNLTVQQPIQDELTTRIQHPLVVTRDGGFFTTSVLSIKSLPQPPYLSHNRSDKVTIVSKYDKEGRLTSRKIIDTHHLTEKVDEVLPLADGRIVLEK